MKINELPIVRKKLKDLKGANYNPRKISKKKKQELKRSYEMFGHAGVIVWNKQTQNVVGGHQGIGVMIEALGEDAEVDVKIVDLPLHKEKALNVRLNKPSGEWDEDKLVDLMADIEKQDEDMLKLTGYEDKEIEALLDKMPKTFEEQKEDKISIKDIKDTKVKIGDVFEIDGKHRIICGDCTVKEMWTEVLGPAKIDLIVTSPPYNVDIKYGDYGDDKDISAYWILVQKMIQNIKANIEKHRYVCFNITDVWKNKVNMPAYFSILLEKEGFQYSRVINWIKPEGAARITANAPYPRWYQPRVVTGQIVVHINELEGEKAPFVDCVLTYSMGEAKGKNRPDKKTTTPIDRKFMQQYITNVWNLNLETRRENPVPYPIELPKNCITFYSLENELVFDPYMRSGTTMIASERLKRKCYGIELDPRYVELSLRRYKQIFKEAKIECLNREVKI